MVLNRGSISMCNRINKTALPNRTFRKSSKEPPFLVGVVVQSLPSQWLGSTLRLCHRKPVSLSDESLDNWRVWGFCSLCDLQLGDLACSVDREGSVLTSIHRGVRKHPVYQVCPCLKDHKDEIFRTPGGKHLARNMNNMDSMVPLINSVECPPWTRRKSNLDVQETLLSLWVCFLIYNNGDFESSTQYWGIKWVAIFQLLRIPPNGAQ